MGCKTGGMRLPRNVALLNSLFPLAVLVFTITGNANASCTGSSPTWTTTPDQASVQTCVTNASSGDTVNVSAGSATWSGEVTVTKAMHIQGPGSGSGTKITNGGFAFLPSSGEETKIFELNGFNFEGNQTHFDETGWGHLPVITSLKVHDNAFNGVSSGRAVFLDGLEFGVFYNNSFSGNFIDVSVIGAGWNGNSYPLCYGCSSYPYFEDNSIGNGVGAEFVSETGQGGRMVWRHNTVTGYDSGGGSEVFDIHGEQGSGGWTATSEYYHNTVGVGASPFRWMNQRGGQALIMNNTVSRALDFNFTELLGNGGFVCGISYPVSFNSSENSCSPANGTTCIRAQVTNSFYFNNLAGGSPQDPSFQNNGPYCGGQFESTFIQQNRDYWLPTYGLESALPGTCTADGNTYYGTTDTDKIYKCTAANTWTLFYQPYTYPHPLRTNSQNAPNAPTNLAAVVQ
ncbi:MAG: hypothetical protein WAQ52_07340 [Terriglobales bacterium]